MEQDDLELMEEFDSMTTNPSGGATPAWLGTATTNGGNNKSKNLAENPSSKSSTSAKNELMEVSELRTKGDDTPAIAYSKLNVPAPSSSSNVLSSTKQQDVSSVGKTEAIKTSNKPNPLYPAIPAQTSKPANGISELTRKWKDVLVRAGLSVEFAWKYAILLDNAKYDESNAEKITDANLAKLGISDKKQRKAILETIRVIAEEMKDITSNAQESSSDLEDTLRGWRNLFVRANLAKQWGGKVTSKYATLLAKAGWNESNVEEIKESDLEAVGISDASHREVIMQLIEREIMEFEALQSSVVNEELVTEEELAEMRRVHSEISRNIQVFDEFQEQLQLILAGDTEKQRQARAAREIARDMRSEEREKKRAELIRAREKKLNGV